MSKARYTNISIPNKLAEAVDAYIEKHPKLDFRSRAQVVIHALRSMMIETKEIKK
jgi:metal-responsive CopG/Arc/MetJ family transcriptional regulator